MLAEESLRLRTRDNDLAAFVVIVARCAGAVGGLASIPCPRADRLPESLRTHLPGVLAEIRSPQARELHGAVREQRQADNRRVGVPTLAVAAVVLALASGYIGSSFDGLPEPSSARGDPPLPDLGEPQTPKDRPDGPELPADDDGGELLSQVVDQNLIDSLVVARAAYQRGRLRSRRGLYDGAAADFGIAREFGHGAYFYDDAVYYQARALHRSGSLSKAQKAYEHLLSLPTEEGRPYRADAKRFLGQLRNHSTEEQVAR